MLHLLEIEMRSVVCLTSFLGTTIAAYTSGHAEHQNGAPWGLARLSHQSWSYNNDGNTFYSNPNNAYYYHEVSGVVTVYMLDTGVDVEHPEFEGRASWGKNFVTSHNIDDNGHGTHLAGIAIGKEHGVARNAHLVSVKVLNANREGSVDDFSRAIDWVIDDYKSRGGKAVINYSADGDISDFRANAVNRAIQNGIFVVNAAGNENQDACNYGPSNMGPNHTGLLAVAALNYTNAPGTFSNYGHCVDVYAPGVDIHSSLPSNRYGYMDGTSNAAAFVSGLVACLWGQDSSMTMNDMMTAIRDGNHDAVIGGISGTTGSVIYNYNS